MLVSKRSISRRVAGASNKWFMGHHWKDERNVKWKDRGVATRMAEGGWESFMATVGKTEETIVKGPNETIVEGLKGIHSIPPISSGSAKID